MSHTLIWKDASDGAPSGAAGLLNWIAWDQSGQGFRRRYGTGQIGELVAVAICQAIERGRNVTVGWGTANPAITPADELEPVFRQLRPALFALPERPGKTDRWALCTAGKPTSLPAAAIQAALADEIASLFPRWQHDPRSIWTATCFILRHNTSAEALGLVEPEPLTGDRILAEIATDPQVRAAADRVDPSLPETIYALAVARIAAQERMGIPADKRVVLFSGQVEDLLMAPVMKMGRGGEAAVLAALRQQLRHYRELADFVLMSALRDYAHCSPQVDGLRAAARGDGRECGVR
jgi:hypothetical protein